YSSFFFHSPSAPRYLHSFPTRRSSDLLKINAGHDQVIRGLAALRKHRTFHRSELDRFSALSKENRAATNSYLLNAMETAETNERSEEHTSELQSRENLVCRLLLEKKKK